VAFLLPIRPARLPVAQGKSFGLDIRKEAAKKDAGQRITRRPASFWLVLLACTGG
jgi:hypothetical protein